MQFIDHFATEEYRIYQPSRVHVTADIWGIVQLMLDIYRDNIHAPWGTSS